MRVAIFLVTTFVLAACGGRAHGPVLVEVVPQPTPAPVVAQTTPAL